MLNYKMMMKKSLMTFLFMMLLGVFALKHLQEAETATESVDFEAVANCAPHSEIKLPDFLQLQYGFVGAAQGISVEATLKAGSDDYQQSDFKFGLPEKGWLSLVFPGPQVEAKLYCQNRGDLTSFYLSGDRLSKMKIFLSRDGGFSQEELAASDSLKKNEMQVVGSGAYKNEFSFGRNTANPYWLQFAIPFSQSLALGSHLNFEVR